MKRRPWYTGLYAQTMAGIVLGVAVGHFFPQLGVALKPLGDAFIALIQMMIGPLIFGVLVQGIASMTDMKKLGRVGLKTLVYFAVVSAITLVMGMLAAQIGHTGSGLSQLTASLSVQQATHFAAHARNPGFGSWLLELIPQTFVGAFVHGSVLPVVLLAVLCGFAMARMGEVGKRASEAVELATKVFFGIVRIIVRLAPLGAFGAMAFTVGAYDLTSLSSLAKLVAAFYAAAILFVLVILGIIARLSGFSLFRFLAYIKDELMIVVGTSSSETVIPDMIRKLRNLGSADSTVGLVFPMGYSFNNAGANIYMTLAVFFLAQANNVHFTFGQEVRILLVSFIASTGGAGVPGGAFVKVAAMLSVVPQIPVASLALLLGVDKLMSECRALANVIGNGVATLAVSRWEGEVEAARLRRGLRGEPNTEAGAGAAETAPAVQDQPVIFSRSSPSSP
ncbi:MAG TPA: C4-dicarboxylate transporter DctA [Terriglobales bacterium]|nr:C4-dicarboxylate transporter DctA [Terriglobales bacterium]